MLRAPSACSSARAWTTDTTAVKMRLERSSSPLFSAPLSEKKESKQEKESSTHGMEAKSLPAAFRKFLRENGVDEESYTAAFQFLDCRYIR